jgi:hypothetical protein
VIASLWHGGSRVCRASQRTAAGGCVTMFNMHARVRRLQVLPSLLVALCIAGCATREPAPPTPAPAFPPTGQLSAELAICDAADAYQRQAGRWPRSADELKQGAARLNLAIPQSAYDRTILHEAPDGRLVLEFRRNSGSVYATKPKPPPTTRAR